MRATLWSAAALLLATAPALSGDVSDLIIEVAGDLLDHGGVVVINHLPVEEDVWEGLNPTGTIRIEDRFAEVQIRYPGDGTFAYRFHPYPMTDEMKDYGTQVLTVMGADTEGMSEGRQSGFVGALSAGGRVVRIPPLKELTGEDEATRTVARWGETQAYDDPPPADERSARSLAHLLDLDPRRPALECVGDERVQTCTVADAQWPRIEALWWRAIAESRLERLNHHALRRCYDGGTHPEPSRCEPDPASDEPEFVGRD